MRLSNVLCTYNNTASLALTLDEIAQCIIPPNWEVEVLCVDNNSSDDSARVIVNVFDACTLSCKYLFEAKQGLSHARH